VKNEVRVRATKLDRDFSSAILEAMFRTRRPLEGSTRPWPVTLSVLLILALLLALTIAPALAQETATGDYYTIKYRQDGKNLWHVIYNGGGWDYAYGVAVDSQGNVIVTGASDIEGYDYYTIKYDPQGNELWNKTYGSVNTYSGDAVGTGDGTNTAFTLAHYPIPPESEITVYLDGVAQDSGYTLDRESGKLTFKTAPEDGVVITADYAAYGRDEAYCVAVDSQDNIIVTGHSADSKSINYYTIKYDANGNELWHATYDSGYDDGANSVVVDSQDNIIVTGYKGTWHDYNGDGKVGTGETETDYYTIKYDPDGNELWHAVYGFSTTYLNEALGSGDGAKTKFTVQHSPIVPQSETIYLVSQKVTNEALGTGDGSNKVFTLDYPPIVPKSETIYLNGVSQARNTDYTIDNGTGIITFATAPSSGVAVTADYWNGVTQVRDTDYTVTQTYDASSGSWTSAITFNIAPAADAAVTADYTWVGSDGALEVAVDSADNVIVTGASQRWHDYNGNGKEDKGEVNSDYCTIKYAPDGSQLWSQPVIYDSGYSDTGGHTDTAYGAAVDSQDNIIVTGSYSLPAQAAQSGTIALPSWHTYTIIKYDPDGHEVWDEPVIYEESGYQQCAYDVAVDSQDNIIVTGKVTDDQSWNYLTIKYDKEGNMIWSRGYDGGQFDAALRVAVDSEDNIFVTGTSQRNPVTQGTGGGLSTGATLGIALGGCAAVILAFYYVIYLREKPVPRAERRRKAAKRRKKAA
jgi:uncharacterized protein (TIGR02217 family)